MSLHFVNAAGMQTPSTTLPGCGQSQMTIVFNFKFDGTVTASAVGRALFNHSTFIVSVFGVNAVAQTISLNLQYLTLTGVTQAVVTVSPGVVYSIGMTYDKDNPSSQVVYLNGVPTLFSNPQTGVLATSSKPIIFGINTDVTTYPLSWYVENLMTWSGYAASQSEVIQVGNREADATTIGLSAAWREWWTLLGTSGAVPAPGDVGLAGSITGQVPIQSPFVGTVMAASSLTYGDPIPFVSQAVYETPVICSSGKTLRIASKVAATGAALSIKAGSVQGTVSINVNGGDPVDLSVLLYSGSHDGILYSIPQQILPTDVVTFTAPDAFYSTPLGVASGCTNLACINRSGKPLYSDQTPPTRVGINFSSGSTASGYWSSEQTIRNWALRLPYAAALAAANPLRANNTLSKNLTGSGFVNTATANPLDTTGMPIVPGLWLVVWDDLNLASPTNIFLSSPVGAFVTELTAYYNAGDVNGVGKARVFQTHAQCQYAFTLTQDLGASDTILYVSTTSGLSATVGACFIQVGSEFMIVTAIDATNKKITVTRAAFGTTAAAYTATTAGAYVYFATNNNISLNISNASNSPNYANLAVYSPLDWTPPNPPAPVVADRSFANLMWPGGDVRRTIANGCGVFRHMDTTPTFSAMIEAKDMRLDTDPFWHDYRANQSLYQFRHLQATAPTVANTPYIYSADDGQTFTATLGADITTTPDAGTIETITITDAATAPVFAGLRLVIDDEVCVVFDSQGDQVQVSRGAEGTTPATHTAGTITVRGRIPVASTSLWESNGTGAILFTTDAAQHKLQTGQWPVYPNWTDTNKLARFPVTLVNAIAASDTSLTISVDSGNWQYVVYGLNLNFDNEYMKITAVTHNTGDTTATVTVTRQIMTSGGGKNAMAHAASTVGTACSGGVLMQSADGTITAWQENRAWTNIPILVTGPNTFITRPAITSFGTQKGFVVGTQDFDTTPVIDGSLGEMTLSLTAYPSPSFSVEYTSRSTSLWEGSYQWVNLPLLASTDLTRFFAQRVRDNLPTGKHKVVLELGNEVWNYGNSLFNAINLMGQITGQANVMDWWILRTVKKFNEFKAVFDEQGRGSEVLMSLPYQTNGIGFVTGRCQALGISVDVVSTAPYTSPGNTQAHYDAFNAADDEQACDLWIFDLEFYNGGVGYTLRNDKLSRNAYTAATGQSVQYICYEGGLDTCVPKPPTGMNDATKLNYGVQRNMDLYYNPCRYFAEYDYLYVINKIGGVDGIALFNHCQPPFNPGTPAAPTWELWGMKLFSGQPIGYGDGRNGTVDNRLCLATPGKTHSKQANVNQDLQNVAIRPQAFLDYSEAYWTPAPPVENDDMPRRLRPMLIQRRLPRTQPILLASRDVSETPPPPGPTPVPIQGRRVAVFRTTIVS